MRKKTGSELDLNDISTSYLFVGEVDSRRTQAMRTLIDALVDPGNEMFDFERFDGDSASASSILPAVMTLPFGSSRKVVVVDRVDKLSPDDQSKIASFIPQLGDQSCLIMASGDENPVKRKAGQSKQTETEGDEEEQTSRKKGLQTVLLNAVKKHGSVIDFPKLRAQDISSLVTRLIRDRMKRIDAPALQMLSHALQSAPSMAECEVEKLVTYIGERDTITLADVELVAVRSPEDRVFPLIDAIAIRRVDTAVHLLQETIAASGKPDSEVLKVLALLGKHFRLLYQTKFLVTEGKQHGLYNVQDDLREMLMRDPNPVSAPDWQKQKLLDQARHFTLEELAKSLHYVLECELAAKGQGKGSTSSRLNMDMLVVKLCQRETSSKSRSSTYSA